LPFLYELMLDESEPEYTVLQHLVPPGTLVGTGQAVAVLSDGEMEFHLPAPKQGLLVVWFAESGSRIDASQPIARIVCEGAEVAVPGAVPQRLG
jgi:acetyl/propionyl-CoA carboxylase alpha subunit